MAHSKCTCNDDASQSSSHTIRTLARSASSVASARINVGTAKALARFCSNNRCSQSDALRTALTLLSGAADDEPVKTLAAVAVALGLDETASSEDVKAAFEDLISEQPGTGSAESSPTDEAADPVPPPPGSLVVPPAAKSSLSTAQLAACKKAGFTPEEFVTRLASAMKRGGGVKPAAPSTATAPVVQLTRAQIEGCKKLGLTHAEFRARMASVKRIP